MLKYLMWIFLLASVAYGQNGSNTTKRGVFSTLMKSLTSTSTEDKEIFSSPILVRLIDTKWERSGYKDIFIHFARNTVTLGINPSLILSNARVTVISESKELLFFTLDDLTNSAILTLKIKDKDTISIALHGITDEVAISWHDESSLEFKRAIISSPAQSLAQSLVSAPNTKKDSRTLLEASVEGDLERVKYLVEQGADINQSVEGEALSYSNPIRNAVNGNHLDVVKYLVEKGANTYGMVSYTYSNSEWNKNLTNIVKYFVKNGVDLNEEIGEGSWTPLRLASSRGDLEFVKYFIENGANINMVSDDPEGGKLTPLMDACFAGHLNVVEYLVEHGANINIKDEEYNISPLILATDNGHLAIVEYLINLGAE